MTAEPLDVSLIDIEPVEAPWQRTVRQLKKRRMAVAGLVVVSCSATCS